MGFKVYVLTYTLSVSETISIHLKPKHMKQTITLGFLSLLFMSSCQTLKISDFPQGTAIESRLPALEPIFDYHSFQAAYPDYYESNSGTAIRLDDNISIFSGATRGRSVSNETKAYDAVHLFEKEIRDNISKSTGKIYGSAVCKVGFGNSSSNWANPIISYATLGIANLFGFPFTIITDELEVIVEIRDADNFIIGRYSAIGEGKVDVTIYKSDGAERLAHARAFVNAMEQIKDKLVYDEPELNSLLVKNGPVNFENVYE